MSPKFTKKNSRPALLAFNGDVYDGFDAKTLDEEGLAFAQKHVRILSGLYGILRPLDLMQPYRLEMGTRLKNARGENLYDYWGKLVTDAPARRTCSAATRPSSGRRAACWWSTPPRR